MNIEYINGNSYCGGISLIFIWGDPGAFKRASEAEMMLRLRRKHDPARPPKRERGDKYVIIGTIVGLIVGGVAGAIVGSHYFGFVGGVLVGLFAGIIVGGIIGATIGSLIRKRRQKTKTNSQKPF